MALPSPPAAPQRGDRATFSQRVDAFLLWLVAVIPMLNVFFSSLTTMAAGGANAFAYTFDTATGDADPGDGKLRLNNATQNAATMMRIDATAGNGGSVVAFLTALQTGTSNVKASVRLQRVGDITTYLLFDITAVAAASGYLNLTLTPRASTSAAPFAANDTLAVFFDPKGDRGDGGNTPTQAEIITAVGTLPISSGGTSATTAGAARTALGVSASSEVVKLNTINASAGTRLVSGAPGSINTLGFGAAQADNVPLIISNDSNTFASAVVQFLRGGQFAAFFGLDTDNKWKVGGLAMGSVAYEIYHQGNFTPGQYARLNGAIFTGNISAPVVTETSDERKKTNWRPLTDEQLDALADLELVGVFDWIDGTGSAVGASAQAIRAIVPWAVHEDAEGNLSVAYGGLAFAMAHGALRRARAK